MNQKILNYRNCYFDGKNTIHLFHWDENGERVYTTHSFKPYYYVETTTTEYDAVSIFGSHLRKRTFASNYDKRQSLDDGLLKRVFFNLPTEQQFLIENCSEINESIEFVKNHVRIAYLDIEVYSPDEFPEPKDAKYPISLITIYDNYTDKSYTWGLKNKLKEELENVEYYSFEKESEMLKHFVSHWTQFSYDVLTGWYINGFDIPYIINRIKRLFEGNFENKLSRVGRIWERQFFNKQKGQMETKWYIYGMSVLDYKEVYEKFAREKQEAYTLNHIASVELKETKLEYNQTSLASLSVEDWDTFVKYNVQDVHLVKRLEDKLKFLKKIRILTSYGLVNMDQGLTTVGMVSGVVCLEAYRKNLVFPTFNNTNGEDVTFEGAFVKEPVRGLHKSIISFDANSLYPNTIITLNVSPETKLGTFSEDAGDVFAEGTGKILVKLTDGTKKLVEKEKFHAFLKNENIIVSKANVMYSQSKKGILPVFIDRLYAKRVEVRQQASDAEAAVSKLKKGTPEYLEAKALFENLDDMQYSLKIFLNSIYGTFGTVFSPLYDIDNARSITLTGQNVIKVGMEAIEKLTADKNSIIYMDTDSLYCHVEKLFKDNNIPFVKDGKVSNEAIDFAKKINKYLNNYVNNWAKAELNSNDPRYIFKMETMCDVGLFIEKKNYILHPLWKDGLYYGKFKYTGVPVVKIAVPPKCKPMVKSIIEHAMLTENRKDNIELYKKAFEDFKQMPLSSICGSIGLNNFRQFCECADANGGIFKKGTPGHIRAAYNYNKFIKLLRLENKYERIKGDAKIKVMPLSPNKYGFKRIAFIGKIPDEFSEHLSIDYETAFDKVFKSSVDGLYSTIGWNPPDIRNMGQLDMFDFLSSSS